MRAETGFDELIHAAMAALHRAAWREAEHILERAGEAAASDSDRAFLAMHRTSVDVLQGRPVDLNLFRENVVRRYTARHVFIGAYYLVMAAVDRGDRAAAPRYLRTLIEAADEVDDPATRLRAYEMAAAVESTVGNHSEAIEYGQMALDVLASYSEYDVDSMRIACTHNLAYNCLAANRFDEAVEYASQALPLAGKFGRDDFLRQCLITAAFAHLCVDDLDEAEKLAVRAEPIAEGTKLERYVHYIRGEVARRRGDREAAAAHFRKLEEFYPEIPSLTELLLTLDLAPYLIPE